MIKKNIFSGKKVVLTGASRGLGLKMALHLYALGAELLLFGRDITVLKEATDDLDPTRVSIGSLDLCDRKAIEEGAQLCDDDSVDGLILNAASWLDQPLGETKDEEIEELVSATVTGNLLMMKHLVGKFRRHCFTSLIHICSVASLTKYTARAGLVPYIASKAAQAAMGEAFQSEARSFGGKIVCTNIYPGSISDRVDLLEGQLSSEDIAKQVASCLEFAFRGIRISDLTIEPFWELPVNISSKA